MPERTTIRLTPALAKRLGHFCVDQRQTQTAVISEAIEAYLASHGA
jgi:predicted transcriptional regulator